MSKTSLLMDDAKPSSKRIGKYFRFCKGRNSALAIRQKKINQLAKAYELFPRSDVAETIEEPMSIAFERFIKTGVC